MADFTTTLASLGDYQRRVLNPYAGMTAAQYQQGVDALGQSAINQTINQRKGAFGGWLQNQLAQGVEPSRMQVASQVAGFDPGAALDVMWPGGRTGGDITGNAALKDYNAAEGAKIAAKMDEIGRTLVAKRQAGQDISQEMQDMMSLQGQYTRYTNRNYTPAAILMLARTDKDLARAFAVDKMDEQKRQFDITTDNQQKKVAEDVYSGLKNSVLQATNQLAKEAVDFSRKLENMFGQFKNASEGNAQSALIAMKSLVQSIDNSVVMPTEMQQIGARDALNWIKGWLESLIGLGRPFTEQDLSQAYDAAVTSAQTWNEVVDRMRHRWVGSLVSEYGRNSYLTEADKTALTTTVDGIFGPMKVVIPAQKPVFTSKIGSALSNLFSEGEPPTVGMKKTLPNGVEAVVRKDENGNLYFRGTDKVNYKLDGSPL